MQIRHHIIIRFCVILGLTGRRVMCGTTLSDVSIMSEFIRSKSQSTAIVMHCDDGTLYRLLRFVQSTSTNHIPATELALRTLSTQCLCFIRAFDMRREYTDLNAMGRTRTAVIIDLDCAATRDLLRRNSNALNPFLSYLMVSEQKSIEWAQLLYNQTGVRLDSDITVLETSTGSVSDFYNINAVHSHASIPVDRANGAWNGSHFAGFNATSNKIGWRMNLRNITLDVAMYVSTRDSSIVKCRRESSD